MKSKDVFFLVVALVIFGVAGFLIITQLVPQQSATGKNGQTKVEVVGPINTELNKTTLVQLADDSVAHDFVVPIDLRTGLGNKSVFGR